MCYVQQGELGKGWLCTGALSGLKRKGIELERIGAHFGESRNGGRGGRRGWLRRLVSVSTALTGWGALQEGRRKQTRKREERAGAGEAGLDPADFGERIFGFCLLGE